MHEPHQPPLAAQPPEPADQGWVLGGRYRVRNRLGAGGMAEVFRANDELLSRDVAVKVFGSMHATPDSVERQKLELHALAQLNHPNLITLYDGSVGADGEPPYLVLELVEGPSLGARIATGPLADGFVRLVGGQIADALAYVHAAGMVHRDVKPENILLGEDRGAGVAAVRARLSDFGIVRLLGAEHLTSADLTIGTASYLAPEQARGSDVGPPADIYSLGLVLLEALTGARAFDGPVLETMVARQSAGPAIPPGLPAPWPGLLAAMTAIDPAARPTAVEVVRALRGSSAPDLPVVSELPTAAVVAPVMPEVAALAAVSEDLDRPRRHSTAWIAAAAAFAAILAGAMLAIARPGSSGGTGTSDQLGPTTSGTAEVRGAQPRTRGVADQHSGAAVVQPAAVTHGRSASRTPSSSASTSRSGSSSAPASSSRAPRSSSAPPSSSSAPPSSSSAPPSSSPPSSSAAPSSDDPTSASAAPSAGPNPSAP